MCFIIKFRDSKKIMELPQIPELKENCKSPLLGTVYSGNLFRAIGRKLQLMGKQTLNFGLETENYYSFFEGRTVHRLLSNEVSFV